jgi:hypothetical protein
MTNRRDGRNHHCDHPSQKEKTMTKIKKNVGLIIVKSLIPYLENKALKSFGWKKERRVVWASHLRNYPITSYDVWIDPKEEHGEVSEDMAIKICRERAV